MKIGDQVRDTLNSLGNEWWEYSSKVPSLPLDVDPNLIALTSEVKKACLEIAPSLSELRVHHLVACVLQDQGLPAYMVVGRDRSSDIVSPAYRSWITIDKVGPVSTSSDVNHLCDEVLRLPSPLLEETRRN